MCPICGVGYKRMVNHFKKCHADMEVFVSRISPDMAERMKSGNLFSARRYTRDDLKIPQMHLKTMCLFCEQPKDFFIQYWVDHTRTHTGEYTNECILCQKVSLTYSCCGRPTLKQNKSNVYRDGLMAFICMDCNYVQIERQNMFTHLETQHHFTSFENRYQTIYLVPPNKPNPSDILTQGMVHHIHNSFFSTFFG